MRLAVQFCTPPRGGSELQRLEKSARSGSPHVAAALTLAGDPALEREKDIMPAALTLPGQLD